MALILGFKFCIASVDSTCHTSNLQNSGHANRILNQMVDFHSSKKHCLLKTLKVVPKDFIHHHMHIHPPLIHQTPKTHIFRHGSFPNTLWNCPHVQYKVFLCWIFTYNSLGSTQKTEKKNWQLPTKTHSISHL